MNLAKLKTVLAADHPLTGPYSAGATAAAAELNAQNVQPAEGQHPVTVGRLWQYLIDQTDGAGASQRGTIDLLREFAEVGTVRGVAPTGSALPARRSGARQIWEALKYAQVNTVFPMTATTKALFEGISEPDLSANWVFSAAQLAALKALSEGLVSVAQIEGLGLVTAQHVKEARSL